MSGPPAKGPYDPDRIRERVVTPPEPVETRDLTAAIAILTDEDGLAHGEAWHDGHGLGFCAYDEDPWPCPHQRKVDRVVTALRADTARVPEGLDVERLRTAIDNFITSQTGFDVDDAEAIAAEYAALATSPERSEDETE